MTFRFSPRLALAAGLVLTPALAFAHPGGPHIHGLLDGFAHPLSGFDHLAAMVAVGLIAANLGGRALWLVPASFVGAMLLGAGLGIAGLALPAVEIGIAASLVVFGLVLALRLPLPTLAAMGLVAAFALFHGFAHGIEAPMGASGLAYMAGFALATAALHGLGVALGCSLGASADGFGRRAIRWGGMATSLLGVALAFNLA